MNIPSNPSDQPLRFDPTKVARETIQKRQPLPPEQERQTPLPAEAEKVKAARDEHREKFRRRVANARAHYTANHASERADAVAKARAEYAAKLELRKANAAKAKAAGGDSIDISEQSQRIAGELSTRAERTEKESAERVRELRERYLEGRLDTDALIARAAEKMLDGDDGAR
jgi:hypothetical protein